ncbi:MAG: hypothetical protein KAR83_09680, partial [Thermodesulfovibrionales bacterium]|nr:hypothetical protein [Thermodesulfovibrionales bacterium]
MRFAGKLDRYELLAVFATAIAAAVLAIYPIRNFDMYWHLANGREMLEQGVIINEEVFSYTARGKHFHNHEWLAQVILYLVHLGSGITGLINFKAVITALVSALLFMTARVAGADRLTSSMLVVMAITAGLSRYTVRPQIFTFLFLCLLQFLLYAYRAGKSGPRTLYIIPLFIAVWDMMHGALFGYIFLSAWVGGETVTFIYRKTRGSADEHSAKRLRHLWSVFAITLGLSVLSPYGLRSYEVFASIMDKANLMFSMTNEFQPTKFGKYHIFWACFAATSVLGVGTLKRTGITGFLSVLPFAIMALRYNRAVAVFCIVAVPLLAHATSELSSLLKERNRRWTLLGMKGLRMLPAFLLAWLIIFAVSLKFFSGPPYGIGYGQNRQFVPEPAVEFLKHAGIQGNMYNPDMFGGYLSFELYPERRIFLYNLPAVFNPVFAKTMSNAFIDEYDITHALIDQGNDWNRLLFEEDKWVPVFWDVSSTVLIRNIEANKEVIDKYGLRYFVPGVSAEGLKKLAMGNPSVVAPLAREMSRVLSYTSLRYPQAAVLANLLLMSGTEIGDEEGAQLAREALKAYPEYSPLWTARGYRLYKAGIIKEAETALLKATLLEGHTDYPVLVLAYLNHDQGPSSIRKCN